MASGTSMNIQAYRYCLAVLTLLSVCVLESCSSTPEVNRTPIPTWKQQYKVVKGDTLFSIAWRAEIDMQELAARNKIVEPYTLFPGEVIHLRPRNEKKFRSSRKKYNPSKSPRKYGAQGNSTGAKKPDIAEKSKNKLKSRWHWPLTGAVVKDYKHSGRKGIYIAGKLGETIRAAASGKVVYSGSGLPGYANLIIIKHDQHYLTAYANNRKLLVKQGQAVRQDQQIAEVGALNGKKPSLYFEIRRDGKPINPKWYLPKR